MRHMVVKCLLVFVALAGLACTSLASEQPVIELLEFAEVTAKDIFLRDVANITELENAEELGAVNLGLAPLPSSSRRLSVGQIEVRMRQAGFNPRDFQFSGATEVRVTTKVIVDVQPKQELVIDESPIQSAETEEITQNQVQAISNIIEYEVVVPVRNIGRHELIDKADLVVEHREGRTVPSNLATLDYLHGKRATRVLVAGNHITESAVEIPPVIDRGDTVLIVAYSGAVQVSIPGLARAAGGIGEIIPVENSSSKQVVYGKVINSEIVEVEIGGLR